VSPRAGQSDVTDLIDQYKAGQLTLEELARRFRARRWPRDRRPEPATYTEMAARTLEDPEPYVPGSWDDVAAAFFRHDLSADEYRVLSDAVADSKRAGDRGEL
jgi:hypothetical protein